MAQRMPAMAEPFKNLLNAAVVRDMSSRLEHAWSGFDAKRFQRFASAGLDDLELKARAMHIAAALEATLPPDFARAADIVQGAIEGGLTGWALWPVGEYLARQGQEAPERALAVLHTLTQGFPAEWAIRPVIPRPPALPFAPLASRVGDPTEHVRRLESEGSR